MRTYLTLKTILLVLLFSTFHQFTFAQGQVSQNLTQILKVDVDYDNPPSSIYIKLNTKEIEVKYIRGSRVMISGSVKLGIPNLFFLDVLIKKGRYSLFLSPDGGSGLRLEDKSRQHMILQGTKCKEDVSYTIYIPESIKSVVFENAQTGDSNIIAMTNADSNTNQTK